MTDLPQGDDLSFRDLLARQAAERADAAALGVIYGGQLTWRTWQELVSDVVRAAEVLVRHGIRPGDRVVQAAANDYAWAVLDWALLLIRAVHAPVHPALPPQEAERQAAQAGARLRIGREGDARGPAWATPQSLGLPLCRPDEFLPALRRDRLRAGLDASPAACDDPATLLATSGTGGAPRTVLLTHGNLLSNVVAMVEAAAAQREETRLLILPLSHIYARTCDLYSWLYRGSRMALAEARETVFRDCRLVQPTALNGVPYFYQKAWEAAHRGSEPPTPDALRETLGGRIVRCYCGGAAVAPDLERAYVAAGLPLLSGYGLTEASPVVTTTTPDDYEFGTVGRPLPNLEVRLADDGEVLVRGPSVTAGYWRDAYLTAQALRDGWLHTGDIGEFTPRGNLRLMGKKKDVIVLSTGKNVWPAALEAQLATSPLIEQACLVGDGRPFLTALVVPNPTALRAAIRTHRWWIWSRRRALRHPGVRQLYRDALDQTLSSAAPHEQVGDFLLLPRAFELAAGETTPKMSVCRPAIAERFGREIDALYRSAARRRS
jgi:long-chain acyl-CoA synthetase